MLDALRRLFPNLKSLVQFRDGGSDSGRGSDELNIQKLFDECSELIARNQIRLAENEDRIRRVEAACKREERSILDIKHDILKRCTLRHIKVLRKRLTRLSRVSVIYHDNISLHTHLVDRLENMRVSGMKTVTAEMLNNITLDCEEMYREHRDVIGTAKAMIEHDISIGEDPDLKDLAKELGVNL